MNELDLRKEVNLESSGRALQDVMKVACFGCGALNQQGLQIKSHWLGDQMICRWRAQPFHIGYPGLVYGGIIASVIDCHAIWTAWALACNEIGHRLEDGPPPFSFVTGRLTVNYLKPMAIDCDLELRARVVEQSARKSLVTCQVFQDSLECASAEVVAVRVKSLA